MIALTDQAIDAQAILAAIQSPQAGASVLFLGTTRQFTAGRETRELRYEGYREMAQSLLADLAHDARQRWEITEIAIVHRLGLVGLGEASIAVAVSAPHRRAAFDAAEWLMDQVKEVVPIWKQEYWSDGSTEWVHPRASQVEEVPPHGK